MGISPMEQRLEKMEADILHIKSTLSELLDISRKSEILEWVKKQEASSP